MTDPKVLIFGSFTEDEIKSLQCQPTAENVEIRFGSLDSATLKAVGISNLQYSKGCQPSKLSDQKLAVEVVEHSSQKVGTILQENGSIHGNSLNELKTNNIGPLSQSASNSKKNSNIESNAVEVATTSSKALTNEALTDLPESLTPVNSEGVTTKPLNGPVAIVRNLLPRGLVNLGNLCFLNATLQALLSCSPFVELLQELRTRDIPQIGYPTLHAFVEFVSDFEMPPVSRSNKKEMVPLETGRSFRPMMFESILKSFTPDVPNSLSDRPRQEDAQEFLSFVMHQMHDELLKLESQVPDGNVEKASLVSAVGEDDNDSWETVGPKNKTAITRTQSFIPSKLSDIFGGQLKSVVKARGSKASATIQPFLLLHLNICPEPISTIEDALRLFSAPETLEGYRASAAGKGEVVSASKTVKILELSEIMILHLMRFSYGSQGSTKLHKPVRFPLELAIGRDLLVSPSSEGRRYELVATITHHGRDPSKGHYTADTRHLTGKWLHCDDARVTAIPTSKVLHDQAYVLFYKQV